ncbi:adhesion G protein-coupled receptor L3-like isoform X1 [Acanthaster planci]|uniref:Adhesion G protein-coupled receptor L3-like isoform X1 n=1 Tax=Acanthaster planci TaxID=133434 RepID=A0A8B7Z1Q0_ACAPL|nr:adhesion G protein-coupled receptor L3-like isoform X1 [Acanthaster planci]
MERISQVTGIMWLWIVFLTLPFLTFGSGYEYLYKGISSEELYDSTFAYWSLNFLNMDSEMGSSSTLASSFGGPSFCSIKGIDVLNGAAVLNQTYSSDLKSAKITLSSYPNDCPTNPLACADGFTVAFWFSMKEDVNETLKDNTCMLLSLNDTSKNGFQIAFKGDQRTVSFQALNITLESTEVYNASDMWLWNHVGMTWDNRTGELTVFSNGQKDKSCSMTAMGHCQAPVPLQNQGCSYLALDEIGIWDRPLNESEMSALRLDPFNLTNDSSTTVVPTDGYTMPQDYTTVSTLELSTEPARLEATTGEDAFMKSKPSSTEEPLLTNRDDSITKIDTSPMSSTRISDTALTTGKETTTKPEIITPGSTPGQHQTTTVQIYTESMSDSTSADSSTTDRVEITQPLDQPTLIDAKNGIDTSANAEEFLSNLTFVAKYLSKYKGTPDRINASILAVILKTTGDKVDALLVDEKDYRRRNVLKVYMEIVNQVLEINKNTTEGSMATSSFMEGVRLSAAVDNTIAAYIRTESGSVPLIVNNTFVDTKVDVLHPHNMSGTVELGHGTGEDEKPKVAVTIPQSIFGTGQTGRLAVTSYYQGIRKHLPSTLEGVKDRATVHSLLVGIVINASSLTDFKDNVQIEISHSEVAGDKIAKCAFLKDSVWSTDGCTTLSKTTSTVCSCSHLTNFAVLVSPNPLNLSKGDTVALDVLTYLGLTISIICLLLTLIILNVLRQLTSTRISILKHTAAALLIAHSMFLVGSIVSNSSTLCKVVAGLTHYFFLAVFFWIFIQGVHMYMKVRRALKGGIDLIYYCLFGWGVPLVIVAISFGIRHMDYGVGEICWISVKSGAGALVAFLGPAYFVLAVNLVVMCMVLHVFMSVKVNKDKSEKDKIKSGMKAVVVMTPILGLTWLFGLLLIIKDSTVFAYLFVIFNCLQGLFIFFFHVIFNDEVRQAYVKTRNKIAASKDSSTHLTKMTKPSKTARDHTTTDDTMTNVN